MQNPESNSVRSRRFHHVAVLMGGWSAEREVSLSSGRECAAALKEAGYFVTAIDVERNIADVLKSVKPDVCFNALHGRWGEDGCIQGMLEVLGIPYTHSGVRASAMAMDKAVTKRIVAAAGVPIAESRQVTPEVAMLDHALPPPYVAKPICEGSSVGIVIVKEGANRPPEAIKTIPLNEDRHLMVERFIPGRELTCATIMGEASEIIDIVAADHLEFYDYEAKYAPGGSKHILPADLPAPIRKAIQRHTVAAHHALGCRGISRCDFRYDDAKGELIFLEINTQPGMTPTSLVPDVARHRGQSFADLCALLVEDAGLNR